MEGSFYEYIVVGVYDGEIRPLSCVIMDSETAKKELRKFREYDRLKDWQVHVLQRLVMAWEPLKESENNDI